MIRPPGIVAKESAKRSVNAMLRYMLKSKISKEIYTKLKTKSEKMIDKFNPIELLISAGILKRLLEKEGKNNDTEICEWFSISKKELDKYYKLYVTKYETKLK